MALKKGYRNEKVNIGARARTGLIWTWHGEKENWTGIWKELACELKFQIQIAEKEAQLLEDDRSDSSNQRGLGGKSGFEFLPTMSDEENIEKWRARWDDKNKKPKQDP